MNLDDTFPEFHTLDARYEALMAQGAALDLERVKLLSRNAELLMREDGVHTQEVLEAQCKAQQAAWDALITAEKAYGARLKMFVQEAFRAMKAAMRKRLPTPNPPSETSTCQGTGQRKGGGRNPS